MERILVPIDITNAALNAVHYAFRIAQKTGTPITFLFRQEPAIAPASPSLYESVTRQKRCEQLLQLQNLLKHMHETFKGINESDLRYSIDGYINEYELLEMVQNLSACLLIMGTREPEDLYLINLLNLTQAPCTILAIPAQAHFRGIGTITLATDFSDRPDKQALQSLFLLANGFSARLHIMHTGQERMEAQCFRKTVKDLDLAHLLDSIHHTYHPISQKNPLQELTWHMKESSTDLLVLSPSLRRTWNKQNFLKEKVYATPILVVPSENEVMPASAGNPSYPRKVMTE
jgi:hypothetical protein